LIISAAARAQSAPAPAADSKHGDSPSQSTEPAPAPPLGLMMQRNGGSLAQATMATPVDSTAAPASSYSFYAVPEPQPKTLKKHDLVQIIVREDSNFSSVGDSDLQHHYDIDTQIQAYMQLHFSPLSLVAQTPTTPLENHLTGDRDFKGTATYDRTDSLTARITAEVIDIKPNGNLVLQATKKIKTDEEEQQFTLTGTCRAEDVTPDDTVLSTELYSANLTKTHKGQVKDTTERGFLAKLLDQINPF
jgi:flagellar L-ring protein precursor FlgH